MQNLKLSQFFWMTALFMTCCEAYMSIITPRPLPKASFFQHVSERLTQALSKFKVCGKVLKENYFFCSRLIFTFFECFLLLLQNHTILNGWLKNTAETLIKSLKSFSSQKNVCTCVE